MVCRSYLGSVLFVLTAGLAQATPAVTPTAATPPAAAATPPTAAATAPAAADKYEQLTAVLMQKETIGQLKLGLGEVPLRKLITEQPKRSPEIQKAATDNSFVQLWEYPKSGITLKMGGGQTTGGPKVIEGIEVEAPCTFKTSRGVGIGTAAAAAAKAYRAEIDPKRLEADPTQLVAGTSYAGLIMKVDNGKVSWMGLGTWGE